MRYCQNKQNYKGLEALAEMEYPGRFIIVGKDLQGINKIVVYGITGRSSSSQARKMEIEYNNTTVSVKPIDSHSIKKEDMHLLVYPAIYFTNPIIVGNGAQTKGLYNAIKIEYFNKENLKSKGLVDIIKNELTKWNYEPDMPHYTPRISAVIKDNSAVAYFSIIKRNENGNTIREFYIEPLKKGVGKLVATYNGLDAPYGNKIESFIGPPRTVEFESSDIKTLGNKIYDIMKKNDKDYRVAVAVLYFKPKSLREIYIINRFGPRIYSKLPFI